MLGKSMHLQRSTETLLGYLQGIVADDTLNDSEIVRLREWLQIHAELSPQWPFSELIERVETIVADGIVDDDERAELLEWCADLSLPSHIGYALMDMANRQLHGFLHGIQSDGIVTEDEAFGLRDWLQNYTIFQHCWPFSDTFALINEILKDNIAAPEELDFLRRFAMEFSEHRLNYAPREKNEWWNNSSAPYLKPINYICDDECVVDFAGRCFCFTGNAKSAKRADLHALVERLQGKASRNLTQSVDYLVICTASSPVWMFSTYGRKIETAMGFGISIIDEEHFIRAVVSQA